MSRTSRHKSDRVARAKEGLCPLPDCRVCQVTGKYHLTPREVHIIALTCLGMHVTDMAKVMHCSKNTIHMHTKNLTCKIGTSSNLETAMWAVYQGIAGTGL